MLPPGRARFGDVTLSNWVGNANRDDRYNAGRLFQGPCRDRTADDRIRHLRHKLCRCGPYPLWVAVGPNILEPDVITA
jgi:hypothetical protein